jgi:hypothetical protein
LRECARAYICVSAREQLNKQTNKQTNERPRRLWTGTILVIFEFDKLEARTAGRGTRGYSRVPEASGAWPLGGSGTLSTQGQAPAGTFQHSAASQRLNKKVPDVALKLMRVVATASISKLQVDRSAAPKAPSEGGYSHGTLRVL